jgi:hypothetical protein
MCGARSDLAACSVSFCGVALFQGKGSLASLSKMVAPTKKKPVQV